MTSNAKATLGGTNHFKPKITVFHCCNALADPSAAAGGKADLKSISMPCSIATREVFLLRAFEAGADAIIVLVCPEGQCKHLQGNTRAAKRVIRMKKLVDEIGLDGRRLNIFNMRRGDSAAAQRIVAQTVSDLSSLGPNPAA